MKFRIDSGHAIPRAHIRGENMQAKDFYADVTNRIVAQLETGEVPIWRQPWSGGAGFLPLRATGQPYRGCNLFLLAIEGMTKGYTSPFWMTFAQARELGGNVRKGERSTVILFCQPKSKAETAEDGTESKESYWISRTYRVFSCDQIDGLPERFYAKPAPRLDAAERIAHADTFISNTKADIRTGNGAFYNPSQDYISLPAFESFESPEAYTATALHELSHWSGHSSRLNRDLKGFGHRESYSREEIIAELSSVMTCAALDIALPDLSQHASYLDHWIKALKEDPRYLFSAASKAQQATDYLFSLQPEPTP